MQNICRNDNFVVLLRQIRNYVGERLPIKRNVDPTFIIN